jgi:hypothetical protein
MNEVFFRDIKIYGFFTCNGVNYQKINQFTGRPMDSEGETTYFGPRTSVVRIIHHNFETKEGLLRYSPSSNRYFIGVLISRHGATQ